MLLKDCRPGDYVKIHHLMRDYYRSIYALVISQDDRPDENQNTLLGWREGEIYANNSMAVIAFTTKKTQELLKEFRCTRGLWLYNKTDVEKQYGVYCLQERCFCSNAIGNMDFVKTELPRWVSGERPNLKPDHGIRFDIREFHGNYGAFSAWKEPKELNFL